MSDDISIIDSLGLSLLGIGIVFAVLVFIMIVVYLMPIILRKNERKPARDTARNAEKEDRSDKPEPEALKGGDGSTQVAEREMKNVPAEPETQTVNETSGEISLPDNLPKKYRILLGDIEYEVDSELSEQSKERSNAVESPAPACLEIQKAPAAVHQDISLKKFRVTVSGVEYDVDSEIIMR